MLEVESLTQLIIDLYGSGGMKQVVESLGGEPNIAKQIIRRTAAVTGIPGGISAEDIGLVIEANMYGDQPDWQGIEQDLGEAARRVYQGRSPF